MTQYVERTVDSAMQQDIAVVDENATVVAAAERMPMCGIGSVLMRSSQDGERLAVIGEWHRIVMPLTVSLRVASRSTLRHLSLPGEQKWPRKFEQAVRWRICYR